MAADIRSAVHSSRDVWREARQVETDAQYGSRYHELYRAEVWQGIAQATRVNGAILGLGKLSRTLVHSGDINTPVGQPLR